ncbi:MAG: hypothetical protein ABJN69_04160 [Hellea sp.]
MTTFKSIKTAAILLTGTAFAPLAMAGGQGSPGYAPDLLPPSSNAGECYARIEVPAQFSTHSEQIMVEEGYSKLDVHQPTLAPRQEDVLVKEASVRYQVRQPTYRSVTEQMMVRPAYDKLSVSAPQFSTVTETIQTSAPRLVWKRGNPGKLAAQGYTIHSTANGGSGYGQSSGSTSQFRGATECGATCEIWCLVEEPGEQVQFNRKVMTSPGQVQRHSVPAKYQTIHKQVVSDPGGVQEIPVPAEYRAVTVEDIVDPGGERVTHVPPKFAEVATKHLIAPSRYEWRRVLCAPGTGSIGTVNSGSAYSGSSYGSGSAYNAGSSYNSGAYTSGQSHSSSSSITYGGTHSGAGSYGAGAAKSAIVPGSRVVTGSGYYGDHKSRQTQSSDHHSGSHHKQKAKRKRKSWH